MKNCRNLVCLGVLIVTGCETEPPQQEVELRKAPPAVANDHRDDNRVITDETERVIGGLKFLIPAGWEQKAEFNRDVLHGEFSLPGPDGAGRLTLSTATGGKSENFDRWRGQIRKGPDDPEAVESEIAAAGKDGFLLEAYGTYSDMFSRGAPQTGWELLGIAIPIDSRNHYFVKLTGPRATIEAHREEVLKFVRTARFEK